MKQEGKLSKLLYLSLQYFSSGVSSVQIQVEHNRKQHSETQNTEIIHVPWDALQCMITPEAQSSTLTQ